VFLKNTEKLWTESAFAIIFLGYSPESRGTDWQHRVVRPLLFYLSYSSERGMLMRIIILLLVACPFLASVSSAEGAHFGGGPILARPLAPIPFRRMPNLFGNTLPMAPVIPVLRPLFPNYSWLIAEAEALNSAWAEHEAWRRQQRALREMMERQALRHLYPH
jgi:hypothetical protein